MKESTPAGSEFAIEVCDTRGVRVVILALLYYFRIIDVEGVGNRTGGWVAVGRKQDEESLQTNLPYPRGAYQRGLPAFDLKPLAYSKDIFAIRPPTRFVLFRATTSIKGLWTLRFPRLYTLQTATTSVMSSSSPHYVDPGCDGPHYPPVGASMAVTNPTSAGEEVVAFVCFGACPFHRHLDPLVLSLPDSFLEICFPQVKVSTVLRR